MKENPVFVMVVLILLGMVAHGFWMEIKISRVQVQVNQIERVQRGD